MIGDTVVRACKECGDEFPHEVKTRGRHPDYCSKHREGGARAATARYRRTDKYRKSLARSQARKRETYDPWMWENTILEWNE